jgi:Ca-activated chloride channel family protein
LDADIAGEKMKIRLRFSWPVVLPLLLTAITLLAVVSVPSLMRARVAAELPAVREPARMLDAMGPALPAPPAPSTALEMSESVGVLNSPLALGVEGGVPGGVVGGVVGGLADGYAAARLGVPEEDDARDRVAFDTESYSVVRDNPFLAVSTNPLSTFAVDVDTASYANVRRFLQSGRLPPPDAVRIEELVNYFRYDYPDPQESEPFSITTELAACPWQPEHFLARVGLQGRRIAERDVPPRNLVFLIDVSGSMDAPNKLPLLKAGMGLLVNELRPEDRAAMVVYAGTSGLVLPTTPGDRKAEIRAALERLQAGGSTAGGAGIQLAYKVAAGSFLRDGVNRVILATDGDFNVGVTSEGDLVRLIEEKRKTGVFLSVLGFGEGNLQDSKMEKLADSGNGNYSYIDTLAEARKVLVSEAGATLVTIAKDVKVQVEFNPRQVAAYRLVGYENRLLRAEDFSDDRKDAGEIGAGHSVTALYEIVPADAAMPLPAVDPLKYQDAHRPSAAAASNELLTVKLRYKDPDGDVSRLQSVAVASSTSEPSGDLRFASAVAAFGMLLRDSEHKGHATWETVRQLATDSRGDDRDGYRAEFLSLVAAAEALPRPGRVAAVR